jgi:hypothetical protein
MLSIEQIHKLDSAALERMPSDAYKAEYEGHNAEIFKVRVNEIETSPRTTQRPAGSVRVEQPATFDPSFDSEAAVQPAAAPASATVRSVTAESTDDPFASLPIQTHSYQPRSRDGKTPIGGLQVFKYRTVSDPRDKNSLVRQLTKSHAAASARIRELSRNRRLEEIASSGPQAAPSTHVPETIEELAKELVATREEAFLASVRAALAEFQRTAEWQKFRSKENAETLVLAVHKANLDPRDPASFHRAFADMREFIQPVAVVAPAPPAPAQQAPVVSREGVPVASGLSRADGDEDATAPATDNRGPFAGLTLEKIDKMSGQEYKGLVGQRGFSEFYDSLQAAAAARRGRGR